MVAGSRLRLEHFFAVLFPKLSCLFFFMMIHRQWMTPREGALVDDLELPSFEVFCFQLLILSWRIDFYFRMISLDVLFRTCTFLFSSVNVCSFALVIVTWNLVWGGCYPSCFTRKVSYAFSPTALAISKSCCISGGASFPVERQTRSCCTLLNGSSQWLWRRYLTSVSSLKNSGSLEIGVLANWFAQV